MSHPVSPICQKSFSRPKVCERARAQPEHPRAVPVQRGASRTHLLRSAQNGLGFRLDARVHGGRKTTGETLSQCVPHLYPLKRVPPSHVYPLSFVHSIPICTPHPNLYNPSNVYNPFHLYTPFQFVHPLPICTLLLIRPPPPIRQARGGKAPIFERWQCFREDAIVG